MMRLLLLSLCPVLALLADSKYPDIVGKPAPELVVSKWLNVPRHKQKSLKLRALRGKVVLIVFLREGSEPCDKAGPKLATIPQRFKDRPFLFIIITRDREGEIRRYLKRHKLTSVPTGIDVSRITQKHRYGITRIPTGVVVDPDGMIAWVGSARLTFKEMLKAVEEQLKRAFDYVREIEGFRPPPLCERLSRARKKVMKGDFGGAASLCNIILRSKTASQQQKKDAQTLLDVINDYAKRAWRSAQVRIKHHEFADAFEFLKKMKKCFRGTEWADKAAEQIKRFKKEKKLRLALEADTALKKGKRLLAQGRKKDAEAVFNSIKKKYPGTPAAGWVERYFKEKELIR